MRPMPRTILVVDDEPTILETLAYNLERDGYTVVTAADGARGADRLPPGGRPTSSSST